MAAPCSVVDAGSGERLRAACLFPRDSSSRWWKWNGNSNPKPNLKGSFSRRLLDVMPLWRPDPGTSLAPKPEILRQTCVPQMCLRSAHAREGNDEKMRSQSLRMACSLQKPCGVLTRARGTTREEYAEGKYGSTRATYRFFFFSIGAVSSRSQALYRFKP